jgi:hypothetical protein
MPGNAPLGWFTLTDLQEKLNRADKRYLKAQLEKAGIVGRQIGTETFYDSATFITWIQAGGDIDGTNERGAA